MSAYTPIGRGWPEKKAAATSKPKARPLAVDPKQNFCLGGEWFHWDEMTPAQKLRKVTSKILIAEASLCEELERYWKQILVALGNAPTWKAPAPKKIAMKKRAPKGKRMTRTLAMWAAQHALSSPVSAEETAPE